MRRHGKLSCIALLLLLLLLLLLADTVELKCKHSLCFFRTCHPFVATLAQGALTPFGRAISPSSLGPHRALPTPLCLGLVGHYPFQMSKLCVLGAKGHHVNATRVNECLPRLK